jgi:hypothetical protein
MTNVFDLGVFWAKPTRPPWFVKHFLGPNGLGIRDSVDLEPTSVLMQEPVGNARNRKVESSAATAFLANVIPEWLEGWFQRASTVLDIPLRYWALYPKPGRADKRVVVCGHALQSSETSTLPSSTGKTTATLNGKNGLRHPSRPRLSKGPPTLILWKARSNTGLSAHAQNTPQEVSEGKVKASVLHTRGAVIVPAPSRSCIRPDDSFSLVGARGRTANVLGPRYPFVLVFCVSPGSSLRSSPLSLGLRE